MESNPRDMTMVRKRTATLTLTFAPDSGLMTVTGDTANLDEALNMLAQAARTFEDQRRMLALANYQRAAQEQALVNSIARTSAGRA